jgi:hypothetical protein
MEQETPLLIEVMGFFYIIIDGSLPDTLPDCSGAREAL